MDYEIIGRFLMAALWGGIVGAEREYRSKSAGFRTMIMISLGSCFFTMMSQFIGSPNNIDRIASNIVTGIGFLGAGVIFRGENRVNGITTAASIWAVAAVGMGIGAGYYFASACCSILILVVLAILPYIENVIDHFNQSKSYTIYATYSPEIKKQLEQVFRSCQLRYRLVGESKDGMQLTTKWQSQGHIKNHHSFIAAIEELDIVNKFEY